MSLTPFINSLTRSKFCPTSTTKTSSSTMDAGLNVKWEMKSWKWKTMRVRKSRLLMLTRKLWWWCKTKCPPAEFSLDVTPMKMLLVQNLSKIAKILLLISDLKNKFLIFPSTTAKPQRTLDLDTKPLKYSSFRNFANLTCNPTSIDVIWPKRAFYNSQNSQAPVKVSWLRKPVCNKNFPNKTFYKTTWWSCKLSRDWSTFTLKKSFTETSNFTILSWTGKKSAKSSTMAWLKRRGCSNPSANTRRTLKTWLQIQLPVEKAPNKNPNFQMKYSARALEPGFTVLQNR